MTYGPCLRHSATIYTQLCIQFIRIELNAAKTPKKKMIEPIHIVRIQCNRSFVVAATCWFFSSPPHFYVSYKTINKQNEKLHHYFTRESVFCIQVTILIIRLFLIHPLFSFFYFLQPKIRQTDCSKLLYDDILFNQAEFCVCGFFSMSDFCWPILVKPKILY